MTMPSAESMTMPSATADGSWVVYIQQALEGVSCSDLESGQNPMISRVPAPLHSVRPSAFTPQTVVIGPFHRKLIKEGEYASSFAEMEGYKLIAAKAISQNFQSCPGDLACLAQEIAGKEKEVRACFGRGLGLEDLGNAELGYMLALDCTFIVAIMHSLYNDLIHTSDDHEKARGWPPSNFSPVFHQRFSHPMRKAVMLDLLLLENQVPLFLVKKVMQMEDVYGDVEARFQEFVDAMADRVLPFCKGVKGVGGKAKHFLDCLYTIVTEGSDNQKDRRLDAQPPSIVPTATELHRAGVKFKGHKSSLSQISFKGHTLSLPIIHVGDETEKIFRNLLAYESQMVDRADVLSYLHFMNSLINTADDVDLLVRAGVLSENIGNYKHVARIWNQLATNTMCAVFTPCYSKVAARAKKYVDDGLHGMMAELKERYLSRPWLVVSLLCGTALLVMTFVIMWYTIELYLKDDSSGPYIPTSTY